MPCPEEAGPGSRKISLVWMFTLVERRQMMFDMFDGALHHLVSFLKWKSFVVRSKFCNLLCGDFSCIYRKLRRASLSYLMHFSAQLYAGVSAVQGYVLPRPSGK